jgi:rhodanese-related sulfurtransferase
MLAMLAQSLRSRALDHTPGFLKLVAEAQKQVKETTLDEVAQRLKPEKDFVLVDVREESEWNAGHLPMAIHLSKGVIERDIETKIPDPSTPLILYCGGGYRSILAAQNIQKMGYTKVLSMTGGFRGWTEKNFPVVQD